ncbi:pyridoxal-phosphate dependent enzyme [Plantactinospora sp. BB1]|uniref:threonine synthase n=1 Tax=Plantactinospora sp. BB1 TaxID=2071627 RepID=UPI0018FEBC41|nr:pyridoxal-phosphate dependent enzyme [Plantactinospora sp. BB1]
MGEVTGTRRVHGCELLEYRYGPDLVPPAGPVTSMWRYRSLLPVDDGPVRYPLPVGGTPLVAPPRLRARLGVPELWLKDETRGPSASNKDRATALVIEDGLRRGISTVTTASTGNAAVATALGAAAAGLRAVILVPVDCDPEKVSLMRSAGALVVRVARGYDAAFDLSRKAAATFGWLDRNTGANPLTTEAKKTVAWEIWEQLGRRCPDVVVAPVGDGPTLAALAKGFDELVLCGAVRRLPRLVGVQAAACQPLVHRWAGTAPSARTTDPAGTVADGIAVDRPVAGDLALDAVRRSGGAMVAVSDAALLDAVRLLAQSAGVGSEPAGAAALAGLVAALEQELLDRSESVAVLVTGRELRAGPAAAGPDAPVVDGDLDELAECLAVASDA